MAAMCSGCKFSDDDSYDGSLEYVSLSDNYDNLGSTFFGYVVNNNSIVEKYACGIHSGDVFCLSGNVDTSNWKNTFYERNSDILTHFFGSDCNSESSSNYSTGYYFNCEIGSDDEYLYISNYPELTSEYSSTYIDIQPYDDCSVYIQCEPTGTCTTSSYCS